MARALHRPLSRREESRGVSFIEMMIVVVIDVGRRWAPKAIGTSSADGNLDGNAVEPNNTHVIGTSRTNRSSSTAWANRNFKTGTPERKAMRSIVRASKRGFTLIELMIVVAIVGILAVLAIYGVRKYLANAKTAEARNSLGQMGKDQATEYEKESMAGTLIPVGTSAAISRSLCISPSVSVPAGIGQVKGAKYQSNPSPTTDWNADNAATKQGFACLKFAMDAPQYYVYKFTSDATLTTPGTTWAGTASGDLNGDGNPSLFTLNGAVSTGGSTTFLIAPNLIELNPEE